jgi:7,8-dihydroneopterin 2',3'-cyclic phosphate phosphodiesterase
MIEGIDVKIQEIKDLISQIQDSSLRKKTDDLIVTVLFDSNRLNSPAAKKAHHAYPGGLIDHTISTTRIGLVIAQQLELIYSYKVETDTIISSCLLHDIFKPFTYQSPDYLSNSALGQYIDHLILIVIKLAQNDFPFNVVHAVAAHHGDSGPVRPKTIEAMIVHLADYVDSQLNGEILRKARMIYQDDINEGQEPKDMLSALGVFIKMKDKSDEAEKEFNYLFSSGRQENLNL